MFIDLATVPSTTEISSDVCIVGCGPAGMTMAMRLQKANLDVIILEGGGLVPDEKLQSFAAGEVVDGRYGSLETSRIRSVGGTAHAWGTDFGSWTEHRGQFRSLDPEDFEGRDWIEHSGWPIGIDELQPYYVLARELCGTGSADYAPEDEVAGPRSGLPLESGILETKVFGFGSKSRFTVDHRDTIGADSRIRVYYHAAVTDLHTDAAASHVSSVAVRSPDGGRRTIRARTVILACGGIENARLMLAAQSGRGIGNEHDLVGRFFMEHPTGTTGFFVPRDSMESRMEPYAMHEGPHGGLSRWYIAVADRQLRRESLLRYVFSLWPTEAEPDWMPDDLVELAMRQRDRFGSDRVPQFYAMSFMSEQAPNPDSRVMLSGRMAEDGLPMVRLDWRVSEIDTRTLIRCQQIIQNEFHLAGVGTVFTRQHTDRDGGFLSPLWGGYEGRLEGMHHHMGTTRMHADATKGVVNADCRVHGMDNLFIAGSSVFPAGGFANPTLTIVALAARLADHLRDMA